MFYNASFCLVSHWILVQAVTGEAAELGWLGQQQTALNHGGERRSFSSPPSSVPYPWPLGHIAMPVPQVPSSPKALSQSPPYGRIVGGLASWRHHFFGLRRPSSRS